jgi:hypothetical protein
MGLFNRCQGRSQHGDRPDELTIVKVFAAMPEPHGNDRTW